MIYKKPVTNIHNNLSAEAILEDINSTLFASEDLTCDDLTNNYNCVKVNNDEIEYVEVIYDVEQDNNLKYFYLCKLVRIDKVIEETHAYMTFDDKYLFQLKIDSRIRNIQDLTNVITDGNRLIYTDNRYGSRTLPLAPTRLYIELYNKTALDPIKECLINDIRMVDSKISLDSRHYIARTNSYHNASEIRTVDEVEYWIYSTEYTATIDTDLTSREYVNDYHCGIKAMKYLKKYEPTDRKGLDKFTIGFEVEKSEYAERDNEDDCYEERWEGRYVGNTELYSHWEQDSSCAMEGVTNVYSLNNKEKFRIDAENASHLTDRYEINSDCGGHTNIGYDASHIADFELSLYTIMPSVGVLYAMFKKRLNNHYSCNNKKLNKDEETRKYSVIRLKTNPQRLEFRFPSAISSTAQLVRRFNMFGKIMSHIYSRCMEPEKYTMDCLTANAYLDVKYSKKSLYKNFRQDSIFQKEFFDTSTYKRTRWLLHDLQEELDNAYVGQARIQRLANVIQDAYTFQSWLDEIGLVNTDNINDYINSGYYQRESDIPTKEQVNNTLLRNSRDRSLSAQAVSL